MLKTWLQLISLKSKAMHCYGAFVLLYTLMIWMVTYYLLLDAHSYPFHSGHTIHMA